MMEFFSFAFAVLFGGFFFGLPFLIGLWMYNDAKDEGFDSPVLWLIVGLAFNVMGLFAYLIVRNSGEPPYRYR